MCGNHHGKQYVPSWLSSSEWHGKWYHKMSFLSLYPDAPWCCNIYPHLHQTWPSFVGKYSSTMEYLGYVYHVPLNLPFMIFPWYFHDISMIFPWYFHFMISFLSFLSQNTHGFSMKYPQLRHGQNRGISWWSPGYWRTKTIPVLQGEDLEKMRQARRKREGKAREQNGEGNRLVTWKYSYGTLEDTGRF